MEANVMCERCFCVPDGGNPLVESNGRVVCLSCLTEMEQGDEWDAGHPWREDARTEV